MRIFFATFAVKIFRMPVSSKSLVQESTSAKGLVRELGLAHAASIVIGVVIGSGIFLVPAEMMRAAGSAKLVYLAWIVGGFFLFAGQSHTQNSAP